MIYHWEKESEEFKTNQHLAPGGELLEGSDRELGLESSVLGDTDSGAGIHTHT